jgi:beta-glucosidase-like glycosyl hydrolase
MPCTHLCAVGAARRAVNAFGPNINIFRDPRWGRGLEVCAPHV